MDRGLPEPRDGHKQSGSFRDLGLVIHTAQPAFGILAVAAVIALFEVGGTLMFPILTRALVDAVSVGQSKISLADPAVLALAGVLILAAAAGASARLLAAGAGIGVTARLKAVLMDRLIRSPVATFDAHGGGDRVSRIVNDTGLIAQLLSRSLMAGVTSILLLCGTAAILFALDAKMASVLFGSIGIAFLVIVPLSFGMAKVGAETNAATARLTSRLAQVFGEIRLVKAFGAETIEAHRARVEIETLSQLGRRSAMIETMLQPLVTLTVMFALVAVLVFGGAQVGRGHMSAGTLTAFLLYVFAVVSPLAAISSLLAQLQAAKGASFGMARVLESPIEISAPLCPSPRGIAGKGHDLTFSGVSFAYRDSADADIVIDHMVCPAGKTTAIVGASGCGKSTLLALVERFYEPGSGSIRYGNHDIRSIELNQWRRSIGYVPQSAWMIDGSIRDNILYGLDREIPGDDLAAALRAARCDEFIARLGEGLETQVGDAGVRLSGGQRQRIALARMFLRDPEVVMLDEATSNLDEESEHFVLQAIDALTAGRTCIVVTHRLSSVRNADQIIVMENGRVVGSSDHDTLLETSGQYRRAINREYILEQV